MSILSAIECRANAAISMIIDFHCHILPPDFAGRHENLSRRDATYAALFPHGVGRIADANALLRDMDRARVDHAVVMGFGWTNRQIAAAANDYLITSAVAHPDRLSAFASVNPAWGDAAAAEVVRCLDAGAVGIGELHADTQGFDICDRAVMEPIMALLLDRRMPITIHASEPVGHVYPGKGGTTPEKLLRFVSNFPDNQIVLAHLGGGLPFYAAMPEIARATTNVWYDTAALPYLYDARAITASVTTAGADRVLFGTDYPLLGHRRVIDHIRSARLDPGDLDGILGGNAATLLFGSEDA